MRGVNGGHNILLAHNTLYRVGQRSHAIEITQGARSCDGDAAACSRNGALGGWGNTWISPGNGAPIPVNNVMVFNNVVFNPAGYQSAWSHLRIAGPVTPPAGTNIPSPARADDGVSIRGNVFWNGPTTLDLGIGNACAASNPTCNEAQLRADNVINRVQPQLVNPAGGNYHPTTGSNLSTVRTFPIPSFPGTGLPSRPLAPTGNLVNTVPLNRDGVPRSATPTPGAY